MALQKAEQAKWNGHTGSILIQILTPLLLPVWCFAFMLCNRPVPHNPHPWKYLLRSTSMTGSWAHRPASGFALPGSNSVWKFAPQGLAQMLTGPRAITFTYHLLLLSAGLQHIWNDYHCICILSISWYLQNNMHRLYVRSLISDGEHEHRVWSLKVLPCTLTVAQRCASDSNVQLILKVLE